MAKLTVKNVGPIREDEFEVKKHTVFIGPQGSGKSTLAKLIAIGGIERLVFLLDASFFNKMYSYFVLSITVLELSKSTKPLLPTTYRNIFKRIIEGLCL